MEYRADFFLRSMLASNLSSALVLAEGDAGAVFREVVSRSVGGKYS